MRDNTYKLLITFLKSVFASTTFKVETCISLKSIFVLPLSNTSET